MQLTFERNLTGWVPYLIVTCSQSVPGDEKSIVEYFKSPARTVIAYYAWRRNLFPPIP
jgi:hypothetical protein